MLKYFICFLLSILLISCNNEETGKNNTSINLNQIKKDLELNKFSNVNISENVAVNWESIKETQNDNFKISEISVNEKAVSTLESDFLQNHLKYQIVAIESEGQLYSYFVEVYTNKDSAVYPETITKLNGFTGTFNVFLLNGENLGSIAIYKGKAQNISENNNLNVLAESINAFATNSDTTNKMPQCGGNYTVIIDQTISRYDVWTVGDRIVAINYVGTTTTRTSTIMPFPCDGSYSKEDIINQRLESYNYKNGSGGGTSAPTSAQIAAALEEQIDGSQLDRCTKAVLDKLKNLTQNDIANIFEKFGVPVNGTYTLKIVIGTTSMSVALADTKRVSKNNYLITISEPYLKGTENNQMPPTDLAIAAIVIHEIIHAHFFALYDDFHNNGNICAYDNYDCLFMEYASKNFEGTTDPQHSQMFENYIDVMANALQEFQTGIPVSSTGKADIFYHDLALSTMAGTQIFKDRYPLNYNASNYEERRRIVNNRTAEDKNITIDDAENGKYIPKGKSCTN
jgi:hypothetical protein